MVILISIPILYMVLDLIHIEVFNCQILGRGFGKNVTIFEIDNLVLLCMLIIERTLSQFLVKVQFKG